MGAVRRLRTQAVAEDAGEGCLSFVWEASEDALDHAIDAQDLWPRWWCDECDQLNEGPRWTCAMCGTVRGDADAL